MTLLLDTHVVLWWLADDPALGPPARAAISDPREDVFVSSVSVWEIAVKRRLGKLEAPDELVQELERQRFRELPLTGAHAWLAGHLEPHHADPFDRALVAQALTERLRVVTGDRRFGSYGVAVLGA